MRNILRLLSAAALVAASFIAPLQPIAEAATPNVAPAAGQVVVIPFHISGQYTATTTNVVRFLMPFDAAVLGVQATARASGGTTPTLTVDVLEAGVTILSAPIAVTAGAVAEGTLTDSNIADEAAVTMTLTIGGSSPTWNDIVVLVTVFRK